MSCHQRPIERCSTQTISLIRIGSNFEQQLYHSKVASPGRDMKERRSSKLRRAEVNLAIDVGP